MNENYFVKIENPKETRKQLLEIGRKSILSFKGEKSLRKIREAKYDVLRELEKETNILFDMWEELDRNLPEIDLDDIPERENVNVAQQIEQDVEEESQTEPEQETEDGHHTEKKERDFEKVDTNLDTEVDRLEYTLDKIENTIKDIDA